MKDILIKNGKIIDSGKIIKRDVLLRNGLVADTDFGEAVPEGTIEIDAENQYVAPGFIDLHVHGGGGADMMDATKEAMKTMSLLHLRNGATTIYPTCVSAEFEQYKKVVEVYKKCVGECPNFSGIHLEGPYLAAASKGAHKTGFLHSPTQEETEYILTEGRDVIKRITAAPEREGMYDFAELMTANGIQMSAGHSDATSDIIMEAFNHGFHHITHFYNATPTWRKINQVLMGGVVEAGYLLEDMTLELIADGKHVASDCGKLAYKIKGSDRIALVTDALRPAGQDVTESYIGAIVPENRVIIEDGVAKLPDRSSFAGSIATASTMLRTGVNYFGYGIAETVKMLTETPARIMNRNDIGRLEAGRAADVVIFDEKLVITKVISKGEMVG